MLVSSLLLSTQSITKDFIGAKIIGLSPSHSALKSSNNRFSKIYKISPGTIFIKKKSNTKFSRHDSCEPTCTASLNYLKLTLIFIVTGLLLSWVVGMVKSQLLLHDCKVL